MVHKLWTITFYLHNVEFQQVMGPYRVGNMQRVIKLSNPFLKPRTRSNILHLNRPTAIISEKSLKFCKKVSHRKKISLPLSENSKSERLARILSRPLSRIFPQRCSPPPPPQRRIWRNLRTIDYLRPGLTFIKL